jgi:hypothetical protein
VLTAADLEVNVLEFRGRSFQFERLVDHAGTAYAVFVRTETESERQLRPRLVRLTLVAPLSWVRHDPLTDGLRVGQGTLLPMSGEGSAVEVAAEASEFEEDGVRWERRPVSGRGFLYVPADRAAELLAPAGLAALGVG